MYELDTSIKAVSCREGEIKVSATGYKMYVRKKPFLHSGQCIDYAVRGGIDFGRQLSGS